MKILYKNLLASVALISSASALAGPIFDTVNSFAGGTGYGVFDSSGGSYTGAVGAGVFDPLAVTALDGAMLALGGTAASPGQIVLSFSTGAFINGAGVDIRTYDSIGLSEGIIAEASIDGISWLALGSNDGLPSIGCSPATPCTADFDLSVAGLTSANFLRLTATDRVVGGFPQAYDLDAVEALNGVRSVTVPTPATLLLFGLGLAGLGWSRRKKA